MRDIATRRVRKKKLWYGGKYFVLILKIRLKQDFPKKCGLGGKHLFSKCFLDMLLILLSFQKSNQNYKTCNYPFFIFFLNLLYYQILIKYNEITHYLIFCYEKLGTCSKFNSGFWNYKTGLAQFYESENKYIHGLEQANVRDSELCQGWKMLSFFSVFFISIEKNTVKYMTPIFRIFSIIKKCRFYQYYVWLMILLIIFEFYEYVHVE